MKHHFLFLLLFPFLVYGANVLELLQEFRETHPMSAGTGYTEELQTSEHLAREFQETLQENYYSANLMQGRIELTPTQIKKLSPYNWLQWRELMRNNPQAYDTPAQCDMTWLQVAIPVTPDLLSRNLDHNWPAYSECALFPCLSGVLKPTFSLQKILSNEELGQLKSDIHGQTQISQTHLLSFPTSLLTQTLQQLQANAASRCPAPWLWHSTDFPGYNLNEAFNPTPVKIIQEQQVTSNTTPVICFQLHHNETLLLSWEQYQSYLPPIKLIWNADYSWYLPDGSLYEQSYYPAFSGEAYDWNHSVLHGTTVYLTIQRKINNHITDTLSIPVKAGEDTSIAINGLSTYYDKKKLSTIRDLQSQAIRMLCNTTGYTWDSQLQATLLTTIPETDGDGVLTGNHYQLSTYNGARGYLPTFNDKPEKGWLCLASNIVSNLIITKYLQSDGMTVTCPQEAIDAALAQKKEVPILTDGHTLSLQYDPYSITWSDTSIPVVYPLDNAYNLMRYNELDKHYNLSPLIPAILLCQNLWEDTELTSLEKLAAINTLLVHAFQQITLENEVTDLPQVQFTTNVQYLDHLPALHLNIQVSHSLPATTHLILSQGSDIITHNSFSSNDIETDIALPEAGAYQVSITAIDSQGNMTIHHQEITVPSETEALLPTLTLQVEQLNENTPVVKGPFVIRAATDFLPKGTTLSLYLNDTLLAEENRTAVIRVFCDPTGWDEGAYHLIAFLDDTIPVTAETSFYYSPLASDNMAPTLHLTPDTWPLQNDATLSLTATDQTAVQYINVTATQQQQIASVSRDTNDFPGSLSIADLPITLLDQGFYGTTADIYGNTSTRFFKSSSTQLQPIFSLESNVFDGKEHTESFQVSLIVENTTPDCVELFLNGNLHTRVCFPETPFLIFTVDSQETLDGLNTLECVVWNGKHQSSQTHYFLTPPARNITLSPTIVQPWKGTEEKISFTAVTMQPHAWSVHLAGQGYSTFIQGNTKEIQAVFNTSGLSDGSYTLTLFIPDLAAELTYSIIIDLEPNRPLANISYPIDNQMITDGMLILQGLVSSTEKTNLLAYSVSLRDAWGHQLPLHDVSTQNQYRLQASPFVPGDDSSTQPTRACDTIEGELARLDLSTLPNAPYTLTLTAHLDGQEAVVSLTFTLSSALKASYFTYTDPDFTVTMGTSTRVGRFYTTQNLEETGYGHGWKLNTQAVDPFIHESRTELETINYETASVRNGGTRDVTVTLSTGQRVTFVFSLQEGGGYTFCYYARWTPPAGVQATLRPICSDKLMVIPEMEPYWEAAGYDTPWEQFDFPGFILTESNGFVTHIDRVHLGGAEIENKTGEYVYVDTYGDLKVTSMTSPEGTTTVFEEDCIYTTDGQRNKIPVMQLTKNEQGRVVRMETVGKNKIVKRLEYDSLGNLTATYKGVNGEEPTLHRRFFYGDGATRHHLTKVQDAAGNTLVQVQYDSNGRMIGLDGPSRLHTETNVFDGVQTQTDALGRKIINTFDSNGYIAKQTFPNNAQILYRHDKNGNETHITDPLGHTTRYEYNDQGLMTQMTNALGETTRYQYTNGQCTAITTPGGGTTTYSLTSDGRISAICNERGNILHVTRDAAGNATTLSYNGIQYWRGYDGQGRITSEGSELGPRMDFAYNDQGKQNAISATYLHPESNQEISVSVHYDFDANGKPILETDSTGNWKRYCYDTRGRVISWSDSRGHTAAFKYDTAGRMVESIQDGLIVQRSGFDAAGQLLFKTTAQQIDTYGNSLVFDEVTLYHHDQMGRILETRLAQKVNVTLLHQEGECYTSSISQGISGTPLSSCQRDAKGQVLSQQDMLGFSTSFSYDPLGQVTSVTDHFGNRTQCTYGAGGRVRSIIQPGEYTTTFEYDPFGQCTQINLPNGAARKMKWDSFGHLTELTNEMGAVTTYTYAQDGQLTQVNQGGNLLKLDYDSIGNIRSLQAPLNTVTLFSHDPIGRCTEIQHPLGQKTIFTYDTLQRTPVTIQYPDGNRSVATFTPEGWMATNTFSSSSSEEDQSPILYRYNYTVQGLLESVTRGTGSSSSTSFCQYNSNGRRLSENRDGEELHWRYTLDGKLTGYETPLAAATLSRDITAPRYNYIFSHSPAGNHAQMSVFYTPQGQIEKIVRPDGTQRIYTYDALSLPILLQEQDAKGNPLFTSRGLRDAAGRLVEIQDTWELNGRQGSTLRQLQYTDYGRLVQVASSSTKPEENYMLTYTYDSNGNLTRIQKESQGKQEVTLRTYDENDRLTSIQQPGGKTLLTWSQNGNLLWVQSPNGQMTEYLWNAENKLVQVRSSTFSISYDYDATGTLAREKRTVNQKTQTHSLRFGALQETLPSRPWDLITTSPGEEPCANHLLFEGSFLGILGSDGVTTALTDITGSVRAILTPQGQICYNAYTPYGQPLYENHGSPMGFSSQWQDPLTGLIYLHNRFYSPELASFLSPDPITPDYRNLNAINPYAYCNTDPINQIDPNGTFSLGSVLATITSLFTLDAQLTRVINNVGAVAQFMATYYSSFDLEFDEKLYYDATRLFDLYKRKHRNATVIVHGVGYHEVGYADDFMKLLGKECSDQDMTSYLWSGFVNVLIHAIPTIYQHRMGVMGLTYALQSMRQKRYDNVNVISHSWGTVLSKEVLIENDIHLGLLATMGSPLPSASAKQIAESTPVQGAHPAFSGKYRTWQNYYYLSDPVVHLRFDTAPVKWCTLRKLALFWSHIPTQVNLPCPSAIWSHSSYWEDPIVIQTLSQALNGQ